MAPRVIQGSFQAMRTKQARLNQLRQQLSIEETTYTGRVA